MWFKYLVYVSLAFLIVALYKANYLLLPQIFSVPVLIASLAMLFFSLICHSLSWRDILRKSGYEVNASECIAGTGLSVFGKYIPGKIWPVVGRAAYIAEKHGYSTVRLSAISLNAELILHWMGLMLGAPAILLAGGSTVWGVFSLFMWVGLTVVIFVPFVHRTAELVLERMLKRKVSIPRLSWRSTFSVMPWFLIHWITLITAYDLLIVSVSPEKVPLSAGLGFALAKTLGVLAVIVPGGIGVREGVLVGYLTVAGFTLPEATAISIVSRLWSLAGEIFIFVTGVVVSRRERARAVQ